MSSVLARKAHVLCHPCSSSREICDEASPSGLGTPVRDPLAAIMLTTLFPGLLTHLLSFLSHELLLHVYDLLNHLECVPDPCMRIQHPDRSLIAHTTAQSYTNRAVVSIRTT